MIEAPRSLLFVGAFTACSSQPAPAMNGTHSITGSITGTYWATSAPIDQLSLGDPGGHTASVTGDGPFEFDDIPNGTPYVIALPTGCVFAIDSAPPFGVLRDASIDGVKLSCDGLAALTNPYFTAPLDLNPGLDGGRLTTDAVGSFLTQYTYAELAPAYPNDATITAALDGQALPAPVSSSEFPCDRLFACNGPWSLDSPRLLTTTVTPDADLGPRHYSISLHADAAPREYAFGKGQYVAANGQYGTAVAASNRYVAVAMASRHWEIFSGGDVEVYEQYGQTWHFVGLLLSLEDTFANQRVGASIAIHNDWILVGAPGWNGVGAVFFLSRIPNGGWNEGLYQMGTAPGDEFGASVAFVGDLAVIGAPGENNGAGGVYVSDPTRSPSTVHVVAPNAGAGDRFGATLCGSESIFVVGAPGEASSATAIASDNNSAPGAGAAYVFEGSPWSPSGYLKAPFPTAGDNFGSSMACSNDLIAVGAPFEDSSAAGVNPPTIGNDGNAADSGAAYVFGHSAPWSVVQYIKAPHPTAGDHFGSSISLAGHALAVASPLEDSAASGVDGDELDRSAPDAGAVFVFQIDAATRLVTTTAPSYMKASNPGAGDAFGSSIALSQKVLVVGAPFEDTALTKTWNGAQNDNASDTGAVYVFR